MRSCTGATAAPSPHLGRWLVLSADANGRDMTYVAKVDVLVTTDHGETTDLRYGMVGDKLELSIAKNHTVFTFIHARPEQGRPRR